MLTSVVIAESSVSIDYIEQDGRLVYNGGHLVTDVPFTAFVRLTYTPGDGSHLSNFTNGFMLWTESNGALTANHDSVDGSWNFAVGPQFLWNGIIFLEEYYGELVDSIASYAFGITTPGAPDGFDDILWYFTSAVHDPNDTLCIDSAFIEPGTTWLWSTTNGLVYPDWGGPYCYSIGCCYGNQANLDLSDEPFVDISDLTTLVEFMFPPSTALPCDGVGNIDGQSAGGSDINIVDLTYFVDFLFLGGPPPAACSP